MGLESTIICADNSEYSRNGDFPPNRFAAQVDAINMLCNAKVNANAESSVGLMTLAGRSASILVTSTRDPGRIFTCLHDVSFDGLSDFVAGIQKAQLALKHRQNTLQRQRIVAFISSPILVEVEVLVKLGKNLKKNNVSVDVVNIGLEGENQAKIDAFIGAVNSNDSSRVLHVAPGQNLADALMNSNIYMERDGAATGSADAGLNGVDPAADPELAMALRVSMEEELARQAAARAAEENAGSGEEQGKAEDKPAASGEASASSAAAGTSYDDNDDDLYGTGAGGERMEVEGDDEDAEMLRRAIEMSRAEAEQHAKQDEDKKE